MYTDYSTSPKKSKIKKMTFNYLKNKHLSVFVSFALILFSGCKKDFTILFKASLTPHFN